MLEIGVVGGQQPECKGKRIAKEEGRETPELILGEGDSR